MKEAAGLPRSKLLRWTRSRRDRHSKDQGCSVGDKSPKAKEKAKKQDTKEKNDKKAAAEEKARPKDPNAKKK